MHVERMPSSWPAVWAVIGNHVQGSDTCEGTIERLFRKRTAQSLPSLSDANTSVYIENWDFPRLVSLVEGEPVTHAPYSESGPPVVVRWNGGDTRVDGRRRIQCIAQQGMHGVFPVLIVEVSGHVGDA